MTGRCAADVGGAIFVVVPAFNEAPVVSQTVQGLVALPVHVVVVDDGSTDGTLAALGGVKATVLRHAVNLGQGAALRTGIDFSLARGARVVVTFDADGQHDPADVLPLVDALMRDGLDVVLGSRFLGRAVGISVPRRWLLVGAVWFTRITTRLRVTDAHNGLRAFRAEAAAQLRMTQNRMAHASELLHQIHARGLAYGEVPCVVRYSKYSREKGQSGLGAFDILYDLTVGRLVR